MVPGEATGYGDRAFRRRSSAFATDIPAMPAWGTPYLFGPGSIHVAHRDDEYVAVDELVASVDAYERIVRAVLQAPARTVWAALLQKVPNGTMTAGITNRERPIVLRAPALQLERQQPGALARAASPPSSASPPNGSSMPTSK